MAKPSVRPFRILALPLVRIPHGPLRVAPRAAAAAPSAPPPPPTGTASTDKKAPAPHDATETPLMLYQVQQPELTKSDPPNLLNKALNKASSEWLKLGSKPRDSWMYYIWAKGEGLMDKIEYEEWALKGIHEGRGVKILKEGGAEPKIEIPLYRPSATNLGVPAALLPKLHRSLLHRIPHHRKMMYRFLICSPLTWPFAIIPVVPNLPLFYVLWRAWSHWKAWRGATYLEELLKLGMIVEKPSKELDSIYASPVCPAPGPNAENIAPDATRAATPMDDKVQTGGAPGPAELTTPADAAALPAQAKGTTTTATDATATPSSMLYSSAAGGEGNPSLRHPPTPHFPGLLLHKGQVPALQRAFELSTPEVMDVNRAIEQADKRAMEAEAKLAAEAKQ